LNCSTSLLANLHCFTISKNIIPYRRHQNTKNNYQNFGPSMVLILRVHLPHNSRNRQLHGKLEYPTTIKNQRNPSVTSKFFHSSNSYILRRHPLLNSPNNGSKSRRLTRPSKSNLFVFETFRTLHGAMLRNLWNESFIYTNSNTGFLSKRVYQ